MGEEGKKGRDFFSKLCKTPFRDCTSEFVKIVNTGCVSDSNPWGKQIYQIAPPYT
jgi:hypothetical protein